MDSSQREALLAVVREATGLELVIWANRPNKKNPPAKAPPLPYATCYVATSNLINSSGRMGAIGSPEEDLMVMTSRREDIITLAVYDESDHEAARLVEIIQDHMKTPGALRSLRAAKLVYVRREGPQRDFSTFQAVTWEGRCEVDIRIRRRRDWTTDAGVIEKTNYQGTIGGHVIDFHEDITE